MQGVFLANQPINAIIPVVDEVGNALPVTSVEYRLIDQNDAEVIAKTAFGGYVAGDQEIEIVVPAESNALTPPATREIRVLELFLHTNTGVMRKSFEYMIEAEAVLVEAVNSFMAYGKSVLIASEIPRLDGWNDATKEQRITALMRARMNIGQLRFRHVFDKHQDIIENTLAVADVTEATPAQWAAFPESFKEALRRAQVIEADYLLGGDERGEYRRQGLMSMTNGESKQFFRPAKPIEGVVCRRAMNELAKWVLTRHRLTRT